MAKEQTRGRQYKRSVGRRLTALIILMIVGISSVMMIIGYLRFKESTEAYYWRVGETTAAVIALTLNADDVERYSETRVKDGAYARTLETLRDARDECEAQTLYVFTVSEEENGIHYIFDTDTSELIAELGDFDPFWYRDEDTGKLEPLYPAETEAQLRAGSEVDTIMGVTMYGWTITVNEPLYGSDGTVKGYVAIDFDVNQAVEERAAYLWQLATIILTVTAVFAVVYLYVIQRAITGPINVIAKAARDFVVDGLDSGEASGESDILSININTKDEMQSLAESLKSMVRKINEHLLNLNAATKKSETDVLTSLCNRGAFEQRVTAILNLRPEPEQVNAFFMIDVDFFKEVNDTYGHAAGDMVLTECAKALKKVMRESDVVGRLGGDEFAVFCKGIGSIEMAEQKARMIREEWKKILPPEASVGITGSIGISFFPANGSIYQELFNSADEALYRAKEAGRDGYALSK